LPRRSAWWLTFDKNGRVETRWVGLLKAFPRQERGSTFAFAHVSGRHAQHLISRLAAVRRRIEWYTYTIICHLHYDQRLVLSRPQTCFLRRFRLAASGSIRSFTAR
jgi:hypothetical protein